ncbi:MAG: hypothetical protein MH204_00200 [Fimbriimonadaceae bacterium]|nr:hypothetical protein [Fimbriimonadaceae bacterium]
MALHLRLADQRRIHSVRLGRQRLAPRLTHGECTLPGSGGRRRLLWLLDGRMFRATLEFAEGDLDVTLLTDDPWLRVDSSGEAGLIEPIAVLVRRLPPPTPAWDSSLDDLIPWERLYPRCLELRA